MRKLRLVNIEYIIQGVRKQQGEDANLNMILKPKLFNYLSSRTCACARAVSGARILGTGGGKRPVPPEGMAAFCPQVTDFSPYKTAAARMPFAGLPVPKRLSYLSWKTASPQAIALVIFSV